MERHSVDPNATVESLRLRATELEAENQRLRTVQRQLEAYRDRYVDLYDFAPLGYATLDEDGYVQEINLAGAALLVADRDELIGYPFVEYVTKEDSKSFLDHVRQCVRERREMTTELRLASKSGHLIPVQLRSIPIAGTQDDSPVCKTAITDITERTKMEEAIRQSRAFLQTVIDAIPDPMLVIGRDYRIALANLAARKLARGLDPVVDCMTCYELSHRRNAPCEGAGDPCPLQHVIAARAPVTMTHTHYDAAGEEIFVEVTAAPVFDHSGEVTHIIETCRDITERKQVERALRLTQFAVDHAGDAVFWLTRDARFFYANLEACRYLGYSREELLSMTVHDIDPNFPAESWPRHWEELEQRRSFVFESQHRTKDGRLVPVEITVNYLDFERSEYNCAFVRDISVRRRAEA